VRQQRRGLLLEIDEHADDEPQALLQAGLLIRVPARRAGRVPIGSWRVVRI
jgi:hypothetical protein